MELRNYMEELGYTREEIEEIFEEMEEGRES